MKTISLDHPVRVYFKDGECYHDSATIVIANGFPSFVRGRGPDVIYPWENVRHVIRVADEPAEPDLTERLRASVAAIADERNGAKQETHRLRAEVERLQALHTEHRMALRAALGLRDDESIDNVTGDFKTLCERVVIMREVREPKHLRRALESAEADLASVTEQRDVLKRQIEEMRADMRKGDAFAQSIANWAKQGMTEEMHRDKPPPGFDISRLPKNLRMTVETAGVWGPNALAEAWRIHEEGGKPARPQPKQVEPGGPIWVRVVDVASPSFGCVGRLDGIEWRDGKETWSVDLDDLGGMSNADWPATSFAVIGVGRKPSSAFKPNDYGTGILFNPPSDAEHQQAQNRDSWRATCLANGAKDCTVYFGPGDEVTFAVELKHGHDLNDMRRALASAHNLGYDQYSIREVRPIVDGVKPSAFKHPADNGQP